MDAFHPMNTIQRIVVIGPESTGKSTLCAELAQHYDTRWVEEYARQYLITNGKRYTQDDLLTIAQGQWKLEEDAVKYIQDLDYKPNPYKLFIDTDMLVMKVWSEYVFGNCHEWILRAAAQQERAMYLLCAPDLPWTADELREYPDEGPRRALFHYYQDMLMHQQIPWVLIQGTADQRTSAAIEAIEQVLGER